MGIPGIWRFGHLSAPYGVWSSCVVCHHRLQSNERWVCRDTGSPQTAAPQLQQAAGQEGVLWLFSFCRDRNLVWVQLIAQSAIYTDFLLLWKALRYCSHLDHGARMRFGPELEALQVVTPELHEGIVSACLGAHRSCISPAWAGGFLPCPESWDGAHHGHLHPLLCCA